MKNRMIFRFVSTMLLMPAFVPFVAHAQNVTPMQPPSQSCPQGFVALKQNPTAGLEFLQGKPLSQQEAALLRERLAIGNAGDIRCVPVTDNNK